MSKELQGADIRLIGRIDPHVDNWLRNPNQDDLSRLPITKMLIGVTRLDKALYPIEIDLNKKQANTVFVVGNENTDKGAFIMGLLRRACDTIAQGYLDIDIIATHDDPNKFTSSRIFQRHVQNSRLTRVPEGDKAARIISRIAEKVELKPGLNFQKTHPHILLIEDLGFLLSSIRNQPDPDTKVSNLKKIFNYKGKLPLMTVAGVNETDLKILVRYGIHKKFTPGMWLFGQDGFYKVWNNNKKNYTNTSIFPFTY